MKRFVIDFEGEEEAESEPEQPYPKYIVFWWDSKRNVIEDCKQLYLQGIPVQVVKYVFRTGGTAGLTGWGVGIDVGDIRSPVREAGDRTYYRVDIDQRHGTASDFKYIRSCWLYEEIAHMLSFFEATPYSPGVVI